MYYEQLQAELENDMDYFLQVFNNTRARVNLMEKTVIP